MVHSISQRFIVVYQYLSSAQPSSSYLFRTSVLLSRTWFNVWAASLDLEPNHTKASLLPLFLVTSHHAQTRSVWRAAPGGGGRHRTLRGIPRVPKIPRGAAPVRAPRWIDVLAAEGRPTQPGERRSRTGSWRLAAFNSSRQAVGSQIWCPSAGEDGTFDSGDDDTCDCFFILFWVNLLKEILSLNCRS